MLVPRAAARQVSEGWSAGRTRSCEQTVAADRPTGADALRKLWFPAFTRSWSNFRHRYAASIRKMLPSIGRASPLCSIWLPCGNAGCRFRRGSARSKRGSPASDEILIDVHAASVSLDLAAIWACGSSSNR